MKTFKEYIEEMASYAGNLGFEEMIRFYQKANDSEIKEMESILKKEDWSAFKKIINKVLGVNLK